MDAVKKKEAEKTEVERTVDKPHFSPFVEIFESENVLRVAAELPGVPKENLDVSMDKGILSIRGESALGLPDFAKQVYGEFEEGVFYRAFNLPEEYNSDKIEARLENGVLTIEIPKAEKAKRKKISIQ